MTRHDGENSNVRDNAAATTPEREEYLRGRLIAALNGYRVSPDDAWDVLKEWMRLVKAERSV